MKRYKPEKEKIKYIRKLQKVRDPVPAEQVIPDKSKYNRKRTKEKVKKEIEDAD